ncbi:unnamed protein product [Chondrus crispus]|uniref:Uncharacterized protein n=1 Tax=Chondrus crispus TaxID=2769 RepID=R7QSF6_CHOCR|nr:unnamed protein product [Chondrus crispus]CDF40320.1 unnamed protein product [Chondrus crispus]|eukprot:XP_005710614.1 unnamed protein product [Chondrus crispus]
MPLIELVKIATFPPSRGLHSPILHCRCRVCPFVSIAKGPAYSGTSTCS